MIKIILIVLLVFAIIGEVIYVENNRGKYGIIVDTNKALNGLQKGASQAIDKIKTLVLDGESFKDIQENLIPDADSSSNEKEIKK